MRCIKLRHRRACRTFLIQVQVEVKSLRKVLQSLKVLVLCLVRSLAIQIRKETTFIPSINQPTYRHGSGPRSTSRTLFLRGHHGSGSPAGSPKSWPRPLPPHPACTHGVLCRGSHQPTTGRPPAGVGEMGAPPAGQGALGHLAPHPHPLPPRAPAHPLPYLDWHRDCSAWRQPHRVGPFRAQGT